MATILFIHQSMPGQFKHLAPALAQDGHRVLFLTQRDGVDLPGVETIREGGTIPDLVIAHPGWGESLFVKDVVPEATLSIAGMSCPIVPSRLHGPEPRLMR